MKLKIGGMTKSGMENKKKSIKTFSRQKKSNLKIQIPAKNLKMKSAQIELKIDFPGFQTMGMNVALSEFEYHEYIWILKHINTTVRIDSISV